MKTGTFMITAVLGLTGLALGLIYGVAPPWHYTDWRVDFLGRLAFVFGLAGGVTLAIIHVMAALTSETTVSEHVVTRYYLATLGLFELLIGAMIFCVLLGAFIWALSLLAVTVVVCGVWWLMAR